jgi:hypothetical protein
LNENVSLTPSDGLNSVILGYHGPTPPVGQLALRGERFWVDRPEQLRRAVNLLKQAIVVGVDAEFTQVRLHTQKEVVSTIPRLALLQLAIDRYCFVVDALRLRDLSPLMEIVEDPAIAILLHGAGGDLRVMAERGLHVVHYYDLEATSRSIFGQHESSLAAMLRRAFAIHLDKSLQRTDWTRRPLPPAMIAYAARDAEVTLALYYWLDQHYHAILQLHKNAARTDAVAQWIEPFLHGNASLSAEMAVAEAKAHGLIHDRAQVVADCRTALMKVRHPMHRSRLLRLIADLSLVQLEVDILPLLHATTADERSASVRALGRLGVKSAEEAMRCLLDDPVQEVRKAAQASLYNFNEKEPRVQHATPIIAADGTRRWIVEKELQTQQLADDDTGWKSRLRSIIDA